MATTYLGESYNICHDILEISTIIGQPLSHHYKFHALYDRIHAVSKRVLANPEFIQIWKEYLSSIHNHYLIFPNRDLKQLDISDELKYLDNPKAKRNIVIEKLISSPSSSEWNEICKIDCESFSSPYSMETLSKYLLLPKHQFFIARDGESSQIIGVLLARKKNNERHTIASLARLAKATGRSVGSSLLRGFANAVKTIDGIGQIELQVRPSNEKAKMLYEKIGFIDHKEPFTKWKYESPTEIPIEMSCAASQFIEYGNSHSTNSEVSIIFHIPK